MDYLATDDKCFSFTRSHVLLSPDPGDYNKSLRHFMRRRLFPSFAQDQKEEQSHAALPLLSLVT